MRRRPPPTSTGGPTPTTGSTGCTSRTRTAVAGVAGFTDTYHYDEAGRLDVVNGGQIGYDPSGNRTLKSGASTSYRADNSVNIANGRQFLYTPAGSVVDTGCETHGYDGFDRQVSTSIPLGRACDDHLGTGGVTSYDYDGLDRQTRVTTPLVLDLGRSTRPRQIRYAGLSQDIYSEESTAGTGPPGTRRRRPGSPWPSPTTRRCRSSYHVLSSDGQGSNVLVSSGAAVARVACVFEPDLAGRAPGWGAAGQPVPELAAGDPRAEPQHPVVRRDGQLGGTGRRGTTSSAAGPTTLEHRARGPGRLSEPGGRQAPGDLVDRDLTRWWRQPVQLRQRRSGQPVGPLGHRGCAEEERDRPSGRAWARRLPGRPRQATASAEPRQAQELLRPPKPRPS